MRVTRFFTVTLSLPSEGHDAAAVTLPVTLSVTLFVTLFATLFVTLKGHGQKLVTIRGS